MFFFQNITIEKHIQMNRTHLSWPRLTSLHNYFCYRFINKKLGGVSDNDNTGNLCKAVAPYWNYFKIWYTQNYDRLRLLFDSEDIRSDPYIRTILVSTSPSVDINRYIPHVSPTLKMDAVELRKFVQHDDNDAYSKGELIHIGNLVTEKGKNKVVLND